MDGGKVTTRIHAGLRHGGALLFLSLAMIPVAFLSTGGRAAADEPPASIRYAVGSPGMLLAQDVARRHWGTDACNGQVEIVWGSEDVSVNARSYWANPRSAYDHPQLNVQCRIVFNGEIDFSWQKFCTVMVHEYGHLVGKPHVADSPDIMSPVYRAPLAVCEGTPDPTATATAAQPDVAPVSGSDAILDAPLPRSRAHRDKAHTARAKKAKSKARARAAAAPRLRHFSNADHAGHAH